MTTSNRFYSVKQIPAVFNMQSRGQREHSNGNMKENGSLLRSGLTIKKDPERDFFISETFWSSPSGQKLRPNPTEPTQLPFTPFGQPYVTPPPHFSSRTIQSTEDLEKKKRTVQWHKDQKNNNPPLMCPCLLGFYCIYAVESSDL